MNEEKKTASAAEELTDDALEAVNGGRKGMHDEGWYGKCSVCNRTFGCYESDAELWFIYNRHNCTGPYNYTNLTIWHNGERV